MATTCGHRVIAQRRSHSQAFATSKTQFGCCMLRATHQTVTCCMLRATHQTVLILRTEITAVLTQSPPPVGGRLGWESWGSYKHCSVRTANAQARNRMGQRNCAVQAQVAGSPEHTLAGTHPRGCIHTLCHTRVAASFSWGHS